VQFLTAMARSTLLAAVVGAVIAAGGCSRGAQPVASPQPFRDEHDPGDGFQFSESAVPAEDSRGDADEITSETTIEIEVDEDSAGSDDDAADSAADDSSDDDSASDDSSSDDSSDDDSAGSDLSAG
jgi:hypothetical protein